MFELTETQSSTIGSLDQLSIGSRQGEPPEGPTRTTSVASPSLPPSGTEKERDEPAVEQADVIELVAPELPWYGKSSHVESSAAPSQIDSEPCAPRIQRSDLEPDEGSKQPTARRYAMLRPPAIWPPEFVPAQHSSNFTSENFPLEATAAPGEAPDQTAPFEYEAVPPHRPCDCPRSFVARSEPADFGTSSHNQATEIPDCPFTREKEIYHQPPFTQQWVTSMHLEGKHNHLVASSANGPSNQPPPADSQTDGQNPVTDPHAGVSPRHDRNMASAPNQPPLVVHGQSQGQTRPGRPSECGPALRKYWEQSPVSFGESLPTTEAEQSDDEGPSDAVSLGTRDILSLSPRQLYGFWAVPRGADVLVQTDTMTYQVHRSLVMEHSKWFRKVLPPKREDGQAVLLKTPFTDGAVMHGLRFMYTDSVEICDIPPVSPPSLLHLPRCVLIFVSAVVLQIERLAHRILLIVHQTRKNLAEAFENPHLPLAGPWISVFSASLMNAVEVMYSEDRPEYLKPIRLAVASIVAICDDRLLRSQTYIFMRTSPTWQKHSAAIHMDLERVHNDVELHYRMGRNMNPRPVDRALRRELKNQLKKLFAKLDEQFGAGETTGRAESAHHSKPLSAAICSQIPETTSDPRSTAQAPDASAAEPSSIREQPTGAWPSSTRKLEPPRGRERAPRPYAQDSSGASGLSVDSGTEDSSCHPSSTLSGRLRQQEVKKKSGGEGKRERYPTSRLDKEEQLEDSEGQDESMDWSARYFRATISETSAECQVPKDEDSQLSWLAKFEGPRPPPGANITVTVTRRYRRALGQPDKESTFSNDSHKSMTRRPESAKKCKQRAPSPVTGEEGWDTKLAKQGPGLEQVQLALTEEPRPDHTSPK